MDVTVTTEEEESSSDSDEEANKLDVQSKLNSSQNSEEMRYFIFLNLFPWQLN